ncbi:MAG: methyltransferase [Candidatus Heimdallarchaeaceae archaeon]
MIHEFKFPELKEPIKLEIPRQVYYPEEDTFLLMDSLMFKKLPNFIVEVGSGSGIISIFLAKKYPSTSLLATDISFDAVKVTKRNVMLNEVKHQIDVCLMDKMVALKKFEPEIIVWNPPYLPWEKNSVFSLEDQYQLFGGLKGYEAALELIQNCQENYSSSTLYTIFSSLAWDKNLLSKWQKENIYGRIINVKKLFFETLYVVEFTF